MNCSARPRPTRAEQGGANLDTEQLLWAAAHLEPTRELLARAGADPDELIARDREPGSRGRTQRRATAADAGRQARPAGRAPDLPRGRLHLHRARAHPVRPGRQPRVRRRPACCPRPGSPPRRCSGPWPARAGRPRTGWSRQPVRHADAGRVRPRPDRPGPGGPDRPGHRPRRRDRADRRGAVPPGQEQPGPDRRGRGGQDRDRRRPRAAHRGRRRAPDAGGQAGRAARAVRRGGRHPLPRRLRGAGQADHRRDPRAPRRADHLHR